MVLLASARAASASSIALRVTDGITTVTILDNGPGDGNTILPSTISWSGSVGGWVITVAAGTGESAIGMSPGSMDLTYNVATLGSASTLTLLLTQYDMSPDYPGWALQIGGTNLGTGTTYDAFADDGNTPFAMASTFGSALGPLTGTPFSALSVGTAPVVPLYSLTQRLSFTSPGAGQATGDAALTALPEPASLVFVGSGLLALARAAGRARKQV
jgi:hypothetical protein